MKIISPLLAAAATVLSGCHSYVPILGEVPLCELRDADTLAACADTERLTDGQTYGDLIRATVVNEARLQKCAAKQKALAGALATCNAEYRRLNEKLKQANKIIEENNKSARH